jgi:hypothetical protein
VASFLGKLKQLTQARFYKLSFLILILSEQKEIKYSKLLENLTLGKSSLTAGCLKEGLTGTTWLRTTLIEKIKLSGKA